jgi:hypothetical protein
MSKCIEKDLLPCLRFGRGEFPPLLGEARRFDREQEPPQTKPSAR